MGVHFPTLVAGPAAHRFRSIVSGLKIGLQASPLAAEDAESRQPELLQSELYGSRQHTEPVLYAALKIDRRRFGKVFRRARDLAGAETEHEALGQHLIVENKIIRVFP